jgi:hypothetical protein
MIDFIPGYAGKYRMYSSGKIIDVRTRKEVEIKNGYVKLENKLISFEKVYQDTFKRSPLLSKEKVEYKGLFTKLFRKY